jgi:hypothetical protein
MPASENGKYMADEPVRMDLLSEVWVFNGTGGQFPAGVFSDLNKAEAWIAKHRLSGTATLYHINVGAYDWSIENGFFKPKKPHHSEPDFIGRFAGGQQHHHYENGQRQA